MPAAGTRLLTVDDYLATPDDVRCQLVEGEIIVSPSPTRFHQQILWNLAEIFSRYLRRHPVGKALFAPFDVYLSQYNVFQSDILFIAKKRLHILTEKGAMGPPDIVVEVLSPSNASLDRTRKRKVYARSGVKELWLIDPKLAQIRVYNLEREPSEPAFAVERDGRFESPLLPGLKISAAEIFRD